MRSQQEVVLYTQLLQFFFILILSVIFGFGLPYEARFVWLYPFATSGLSCAARVLIEQTKYDLVDKEGRKLSKWRTSVYEQWSKGYRGVKVRNLPDWFLPIHIAFFTIMSVAYVLIASFIAGEFVFFKAEYAHLSIPIVIFYHFVIDFEGWKRIITNPKALYYSFAYSTAGVIFWFVMMQIGVFPSFKELFAVTK